MDITYNDQITAIERLQPAPAATQPLPLRRGGLRSFATRLSQWLAVLRADPIGERLVRERQRDEAMLHRHS